jgi:hypothetical protein
VRFAPGWITELTSDGDPASLAVHAVDATPGTRVELWAHGQERPTVTGTGIARVDVRRLDQGWRITAQVCAATYTASLGAPPSGPADDVPRRCRR